MYELQLFNQNTVDWVPFRQYRAHIQMFYFFAKMLLNCPKYAQLMKISIIKLLCCNEQHQTYCKSLTFPVIQQENL